MAGWDRPTQLLGILHTYTATGQERCQNPTHLGDRKDWDMSNCHTAIHSLIGATAAPCFSHTAQSVHFTAANKIRCKQCFTRENPFCNIKESMFNRLLPQETFFLFYIKKRETLSR